MKLQAEAYLNSLRNERLSSENTVLAYKRDLSKVFAFCDRHNITEWDQIQPEHVRKLVVSEKRKDQKSSSINRLLATVRNIYRYLGKFGLCSTNPALGITGPKGESRLPKVLDQADTAKMLDGEVKDTFLDRRDQAIMELFYSSGLRLSELVDLDLSRLDLKAGMALVRGKGGNDRIVPVGRKAREALAEWMKWRGTVEALASNVFIGQTGKALTPRAVQLRVKAFGERSLGVSLHPHTLRHTCATHVLQSSQDLRAVQELLGHADIGTTQVYTHLDYTHLSAVYTQTHPRAKRPSV